jgi:hypothetical protein
MEGGMKKNLIATVVSVSAAITLAGAGDVEKYPKTDVPATVEGSPGPGKTGADPGNISPMNLRDGTPGFEYNKDPGKGGQELERCRLTDCLCGVRG